MNTIDINEYNFIDDGSFNDKIIDFTSTHV